MPFLPPGNLAHPGMGPVSLAYAALTGRFFILEMPGTKCNQEPAITLPAYTGFLTQTFYQTLVFTEPNTFHSPKIKETLKSFKIATK